MSAPDSITSQSSFGRSVVYLMYHEIELPGRRMYQDESGYRRYVVRHADFEAQIRWLQSAGWHGQCVSEALANPQLPGVVITFDDGCETDLLTAAPLLRELGVNATFYITVGFLGKPGFLTRAQLRELTELGFEIGSHSLTHAYLTDLAPAQLAREIADSRKELSQITGRPIDHFSCPGGRWDLRVIAAAKQAGYRSVASSEAVANPVAPAQPFPLGRLAIMRETDLEDFRRLVRGHGLWKIRLGDSARSALKRALGNSTYDRLRARVLDRKAR
jgi:peptidoglycan/xylan/chitin deacetylase (PgdA/CDA1 family)